jgi:hypothetical protein
VGKDVWSPAERSRRNCRHSWQNLVRVGDLLTRNLRFGDCKMMGFGRSLGPKDPNPNKAIRMCKEERTLAGEGLRRNSEPVLEDPSSTLIYL